MMRIRRTRLAVLMILMLVVSAACKEPTLKALADDLGHVIDTMKTVQTTVIAANATVPPLISSDAAIKVLAVCLHIDRAVKASNNAAKSIATLDDASKHSLAGILTPIINEVNTAIGDSAITGIQDEKTRTAVKIGLLELQTTLATINTIIAVKAH